ncbi:MAG: hypothetical protein ABI793_14560, partial [Flavobacterium sp.]
MVKSLIYLVVLVLFFIGCNSNRDIIDLEKIEFNKSIKKFYSDINCIDVHEVGKDTTVGYTNMETYGIFKLGVPYHPSNRANITKWTLPGYLYFEQSESLYSDEAKEE